MPDLAGDLVGLRAAIRLRTENVKGTDDAEPALGQELSDR